jgi:hypothetical protein
LSLQAARLGLLDGNIGSRWQTHSSDFPTFPRANVAARQTCIRKMKFGIPLA